MGPKPKVLLAVTMLAQVLSAQYSSGIQGTVVDKSGAVIPGAKITVTNVDTGVVHNAVSSETGVYRVPSLNPGTYKVLGERKGFAPVEQTAVTVQINEIRRVDLTMAVGGVVEKVTITAEPPALETEQGRISGTLSNQQLQNLPVPGRNIYNLMSLQPGVTGRSFANDVYNGEPAPGVRSSGNRQESNYFTVDDTSVNSVSRGGTINITPNVDSVAEVRVQSHNFSAEEGRNAGAHFQVVTKGGTNEFHGSLSEYFQNNTLSSRNPFETSVPVNRQNQFGYSLGGPIIKNRTFFFTSYEGVRRSGGRASLVTVETPEFREFVKRTRPNSIAAKLLDQFRPAVDPTSVFRDLGSPAPGVNVWNSAPDGIMDVGSASFAAPSDRRGDQFNVRIDHELRPGKDRLYGNWYRTKVKAYNFTSIRPAFDRRHEDTMTFGNINYTHIFTPTMLNEFRAGIMRLAGVPAASANPQVPEIGITGMGTNGATIFQSVNVFPGGWFQTNANMKNTLSWMRGAHNIKVGGELRRMHNNLRNTRSLIPVYTFNSLLDFADDEAWTQSRTVNPQTGQPTITDCAIRVWEGGLFFQDDWKVRRDLTLNLGIRWEYYGPMTDATNRLRGFVFGQGGSYRERLANGKVDVIPEMWPPDKTNFGPRFGFAYDVGAKGKMVLRGGYGMSFDRLATVVPGSYRDNPPLTAVATLGPQFGTQFTYTLGDTSKPFFGYPVDPGLTLGLDARNGIRGARVTIVGVDPLFKNPYSHDWFFGLQRALPGNLVAEIGYLGTAGHHLINVTNINRFAGDMLDGRSDLINPSFSAINQSQSTSDSIYHGGTFSLKRKFQQGFTVEGAYTFGKIITDAETAQSNTNYQDAANRRRDRSLASFDVPQRLSFFGVWDLPFLRNCKDLVCKVVGGWQFSGYGVLEKGNPFSVYTTAVYPRGDFNADNLAWDFPNAPATSLTKNWNRSEFMQGIFPASAFPTPPPGAPGNLGRNVFRGPGFARVDLSLGKNFKVTERVSTMLRGEAFNAFNRVNLNNPVSDMANNAFGRSTSAQAPRQYQVSLQVRF